jgi:nitroreductase
MPDLPIPVEHRKPADTQHDILPVLAQRWSPRSYAADPVEPEQLRQCFEAARWAASSYNEQPWRFHVGIKHDAEHPEAYEKLLGLLVEANRAWAKDAPVLIVTAVSTIFDKNGKPNRCAEHDLGQAVANFSTQATALGLFVHQMAGIDLDAAKETLQLPGSYRAFSALTVGHAAPADLLTEDWMVQAEQADRQRKSFDEFVFGTTFDQPSPLF